MNKFCSSRVTAHNWPTRSARVVGLQRLRSCCLLQTIAPQARSWHTRRRSARCGSSATSCGPLPRSAATPRNSRPTHRLGAASHPPLYHCNTLRKRAVMRCAAEPPVLPPPPCPNAWPAPADVHASQRLKPFCAQAAELPAICAELHARLAGHEAKRRFAPNRY